jgi:HK97 family phage major capsid protein
MNIKALKQAKADLEAAEKALKAEGRTLLAIAQPTDKQTARLNEIDGDLKANADQQAENATALARAERYAEDEKRQGTYVAGERIEAGADHATEKPWGSFGEFLQAVAYSVMPGKSSDPRLYATISGASTSVPADGGHLVRTDWSTMLLDKAQEAAVLAPKCTSIEIGEDFDGVELPYVDETSRATGSRWGGVRVYRAAEADSVTSSKPKVGRKEIRVEDLKALFYATDRSLRDARALESIATKAFASEFAFKVDDEIIRGTGAGEIQGVIATASLSGAPTVSVAKETGQAADTFLQANISKMWARLHPRHKGNAVWLVNHELGPQLDVLSIPAGTGALEPRFVSYGPDGVLRIKGKPVIEVEQCSAVGDQGDVILADLSQMLLVKKGGIQAASSMHVRFIFDEMTFRWTYRINGMPAWRSAVTPYKGTSGATLSPFVTLDAR